MAAAATTSFLTSHHHRSISHSPSPVAIAATISISSSYSSSSSSSPDIAITTKPHPQPITLFSRRPLFHLAVAAASFYESNDEEEEEEVEEVEECESDYDDEKALGDSVSTSRSRSSPSSSTAGRLYVGNLPYSMTPSQLADVFIQAGSVQGVEVVYDRVTDRSRGFAFVTMATAQDANEAIRMFNGAQVGGRTVKVNFPEVPRGGEREVIGPRIRSSNRGFVDSPYKVYAGNLAWSVTSESLRLAFADHPGVLGARVVYDRDSGRSRGYGFVSFHSPEEAQSAIDSMDAKELQGRPLRLSHAAERTSTITTKASAFA